MTLRQKSTPPQYAKEISVSPDKVIVFIKSGELKAMDISTDRGSPRPRYLIDRADIIAFEASRAIIPPAAKVKRRRRRRDPAIKEYF